MIRDFSAQSVSNLIIASISFFVTLIISRYLGPEKFGIYSIALAAGSIFSILADGGFKTLILRESTSSSAINPLDGETIISYARYYLIIACASAGVLGTFFLDPERRLLGYAVIICFASLVMVQQYSSMLRGQGRLVYDAIFVGVVRLISAAGIIFLVVAYLIDIWAIFLTWGLLTVFILYLYQNGQVRSIRSRGLFRLLKLSLPFLTLELMICMYLRVDLFLLDYFGIPESEIGRYAAAYKICEAFMILVSPIGIISFRYFRISNRSPKTSKFHVKKVLLVSLLISIPMILFCWIFGELAVGFLFGKKFSGTGLYLSTLALMLVFVLPNLILNQLMLAHDLERQLFYIMGISLLINVATNYILIPVIGIYAAALGKIMTEASVCLMLAWATCRINLPSRTL